MEDGGERQMLSNPQKHNENKSKYEVVFKGCIFI
jgi:hypothetical protein